MPKVWKPVLRVGEFHTRTGPIRFTAGDLRRLASTGREMVRCGLWPPVPLEHVAGAKPQTKDERQARRVAFNTGFARDFRISADGQELSALLDVSWLPDAKTDEEIEQRLRTTIPFVSPEISPALVDGSGRRWSQCISHVALCVTPVDHGQRPFYSDGAALTLSRAKGPLRLSLATWRPAPMKTATRKPVTRDDLVRIAAKARQRRIKMSSAELIPQEEPLSLEHLRNRINEAREVMDRLAQRSALQPMTTLAAPWMPGFRAALDNLISTGTAALEKDFVGAGMSPAVAVAMSRPTARPTDEQAVGRMLELAGVGR